MMAYWLFKSEPHTWSWNDQLDAGQPGTTWDGVRNYQARNNMRNMEIGELGFFYHSGAERQIMGTVRVIARAHPDPTTDDPRWECVDIAAETSLEMPISLAQIKQTPELSDMVLVNNSRLSVQPVRQDEWQLICALAKISS